MMRDLLAGGLSRASHALTGDEDFSEQAQMTESGSIIRWTPAEQLLPLSPPCATTSTTRAI